MFKIGNKNIIKTNCRGNFPYIDSINIENFHSNINFNEKVFNDITVDIWIYSSL